MKQYNFDEVIERTGTSSVKWEADFHTQAKQIYPLWVADMDFACCDEIIDALHKRVDERIYGYNKGFDEEYKEVVSSWFKKRFDWIVDKNAIFHCGGIVSAIAYVLEILSDEQDGIIIQTPVYHPFRKKIEATKRKVVENPLINTAGYYTMDYVTLEQQMSRSDVKGMILCSPHNPVGRVWKEEELLRVVEIAKKYDKWIISDEIHCDIIRSNQQHIPLLKLCKDYEQRIIACTAPSKTFNLAGLQNSNIILPNKEYQTLWKEYVQERLSISTPNSFALSACIAAYEHGEEWLQQVNTYIDENIRCATEYLNTHLKDAVVTYPEGTYLLWVDVRAYCQDEKKLEQALRSHGVILNEGYIFGKEGTCFERINVACPKDLLMRCLEVFTTVIKEV
ncbi:MalY/PatB family protein [Amedibacillus sp. YH-ame6]